MGGIVVAGIHISYHDLVCVFECGMGWGEGKERYTFVYLLGAVMLAVM